jgi:hypothetical protein
MAKRPKYELRTERLVLTPPATPDPEPELSSPAKAERPRPEMDWQAGMAKVRAREARQAAQRRGELPSNAAIATRVVGKGLLGVGLTVLAVSVVSDIASRPGGRLSTPKVN